MPRYVELKRCFEAAGFEDVRTLLSSGNAVFSTARSTATAALERRAEKAMQLELGASFLTFVRPARTLQDFIASDPFGPFELLPAAKRIVTFLRQPPASGVALPIERDGAKVLKVGATEVLCAYVPNEKGPVFMNLLERSFGKDITTRTLDTVRKCAVA
jgi:uncharacterized protein (DUF1697 family)